MFNNVLLNVAEIITIGNLCYHSQYRIFLHSEEESIWALHGVKVISLSMRPSSKQQVCVNFSFNTFASLLALFPFYCLVFQVQQDLVPPSSMKSGKMKTSTLLFCANSLTSRITFLLACKQSGRICPARTRNLSKSPDERPLSLHK